MLLLNQTKNDRAFYKHALYSHPVQASTMPPLPKRIPRSVMPSRNLILSRDFAERNSRMMDMSLARYLNVAAMEVELK